MVACCNEHFFGCEREREKRTAKQEDESQYRITQKLGIIKSQKVNREVLKWSGDSEALHKPEAEKQKILADARKRDRKCRSCCMLFGSTKTLFVAPFDFPFYHISKKCRARCFFSP